MDKDRMHTIVNIIQHTLYNRTIQIRNSFKPDFKIKEIICPVFFQRGNAHLGSIKDQCDAKY